MARYHIQNMLKQADTTRIAVLCEPSPVQYDASAEIFRDAGLEPPPNEPDLDRLLADYDGELDAAFIITPHAYHHDQTMACLEAGLDVLLEKPMVMNAAEARSLIETRDRTGRLLVVAFPGSLSPQIRTAARCCAAGSWAACGASARRPGRTGAEPSHGTWRQQPSLSGGGFLFDTGAHMLNTIADLAGEDFVEVAAWLDNNGRPVDTRATVMARLASGVLVTMHGCGEAIPSCASDIRVFCRKGHPAHRHLGRAAGAPAPRPEKSPPGRRARIARRLGAVPRGARRQDCESLPARSRAAHGPAVGRNPGVGGAGWTASECSRGCS